MLGGSAGWQEMRKRSPRNETVSLPRMMTRTGLWQRGQSVTYSPSTRLPSFFRHCGQRISTGSPAPFHD